MKHTILNKLDMSLEYHAIDDKRDSGKKRQKSASMMMRMSRERRDQQMHISIIDEIFEIRAQEITIDERYHKEHALHQALQISDLHEKCKALVSLSSHRLGIFMPQQNETVFFAQISPGKNHKSLLISDFSIRLPTREMCIFLVCDGNMEYVPSLEWKQRGVERDFHIFLHCSTILSKLGSLDYANDHTIIILNDCRWILLKQMEATHGICAKCGEKHPHQQCYFQFCIRCGREGHSIAVCYACKDVLKRPLEN